MRKDSRMKTAIALRSALALATLCLLTLLPVSADTPPPPPLLDAAQVMAAAALVTTGAYPNADEVLVDELTHTRYEAAGTAVTWDDQYVKVLTEKGKREGRSMSFSFTLPYDTVTVVRAEILRPDGTALAVDLASQSRVMVSPDQMDKNIYNPNQKILTVGLPGLEVGDVYHVTTRNDTLKARVPDAWADFAVFEYTSPIRRLVYEVDAPAALPLRHAALKGEIPGTVTRSERAEGDRTVHRWEVRDVPRFFEEPNMPPYYTVVQRLLLSTTPSWPDLSRWYWNLCRPHLEAVNDGLRQKVTELTAGAADRDERIRRLFRFVSQQIRYMGVTTETEAPGYEPHDASATFDQRYGVCRDKAALLAAMLRLAGEPAFPVIIDAGPRKDEEVPLPYFNHAIVAVRNADGGYLLMDPTDESTTDLLPSYLCNKSYLVAHPDGDTLRTSPILPAESNLLRIATEGVLDASGTLTATSTLRFEGINDNAYRGHFARLKPIERRRYFEGLVKRRAAGAALKDVTLTPADMQDTTVPLTAVLTYEAADYPVTGDGYALLPLPWLSASAGYVNFVLGQTGLPERRFPLSTEIACGVRETCTLDTSAYPARVVELPAFTPKEDETLAFRAEVRAESNALAGSVDFLVRTVEFTPAQYGALKQRLKDIEVDRRKMPILKRDDAGAGGHDVRVLSATVRYELRDAHTWREIETVRKQVLTYAGKKDHSELKVAYNTAWETARLAYGRVTGADGTVREVAASETNVMDAAWVASAPRYPAERVLVASLPGVEVGSVVEYQIVREVRGVPFFSASATFAATEPVLTNRFEVACPKALALAVNDRAGSHAWRDDVTEGDTRTRTWVAAGQPVLPREESQPPLWSFQPSVWVSGGNWEAYAGEVEAALDAAAGQDRQARRTARELVAGVRDPAARLRILRDHVARAVRRAGPGFTDVPLACMTPADRSLAEGYGNDADAAIVLFAMLRAAGLKPEFVLSSHWSPQMPALREGLIDPPQRALFDTVLVRARVGGRLCTLGDTDEYAEPGATPHDGRPALDMEGRIGQVDSAAGLRNRMAMAYDIRLDADGGAVVAVRQEFAGDDYAEFHRKFAELPPEERRRYYLELLGQVSQSAEAGTELVTSYERHPGVLTFTARVPRYAVRSGPYLSLALPGQAPDLAALRADRRETPLYRPAPLDVTMSYTVTVSPGHATVLLAPPEIEWSAPGGLGRVSSTMVEETAGAGATNPPPLLRLEKRFTLNSAVIQPEDYPSVLEMNRRLKHPRASTVLLQVEP
jgi:transglutaminase-like putative cysteine protease